MKIVVLNAGGGSQRVSLFELPDSPPLPENPREPVWEASIHATAPGQPEGELHVRISCRGRETRAPSLSADSSPSDRVRHLLGRLWSGPDAVLASPAGIDAVGHRVVHGGEHYAEATLVDHEVEAAIDGLSALAPLHNPVNLAGLRTARALCDPNTRHFAVFDTAFHRTLPAAAATYAVPFAWLEQGVHRYGFHGTSFRWSALQAARLLRRATDDPELRLIICHLGSGCSLCATRGGRSLDTTMGFTPLDGLVMSTRAGSLDPGILLHFVRQGLSVDELEEVLNRQSGLAGLSGLGGDTRDILPRAKAGHPRARLAIDVFIHQLRAGIGRMIAALGAQPHALVFTDAIAEDEPDLRAAACEAFTFLGVQLDPAKNRTSPLDTDLARTDSPVRILLVKSREAWQIAREGHALLTG